MKSLRQVAFLLLLLTLLSGLQLSFADSALPKPVGLVVWVKGTLKATMPNNEQRLLQKSSVIYLHDVLTTDANSQAQIVFTDNTLMTFKEGTKFVIDQYSFDPKIKKGSKGQYIMNLMEGGFRTITGLIAKSNPSDYKVNTPVATIGVRGTDYAVYLKGTQLVVGYYSGSPCVTGGGKSGGQLCLSKDTPYAQVADLGAAPVPLSQQPTVFKEKLEIKAVTISPLENGGTVTKTIYRNVNGGPISSFCISQ